MHLLAHALFESVELGFWGEIYPLSVWYAKWGAGRYGDCLRWHTPVPSNINKRPVRGYLPHYQRVMIKSIMHEIGSSDKVGLQFLSNNFVSSSHKAKGVLRSTGNIAYPIGNLWTLKTTRGFDARARRIVT